MKVNLFAAAFIITMALLIFKALGYITIGWFWVFFPVVSIGIIWLLIVLFVLFVAIIAAVLSKD